MSDCHHADKEQEASQFVGFGVYELYPMFPPNALIAFMIFTSAISPIIIHNAVGSFRYGNNLFSHSA